MRYGYPSDGGKTFPFGGTGIGLMPSLDEIFQAFPDNELLIHIKNHNPEIADVLWNNYLSNTDENRRGQITVYGENEPI